MQTRLQLLEWRFDGCVYKRKYIMIEYDQACVLKKRYPQQESNQCIFTSKKPHVWV